MTTFEIYDWQPPGWDRPHPVVIVSHPDRAHRKDPVEVVACASQRTSRPPQVHEVLLDEADGLDWPTLCKCDLIYAVARSALSHKRGIVAEARRAQLARTIIAAHGWAAVL
jgi:mRNA-degrading endonuclease toxin of MazEF toxin-antitoxin module